MKIISYAIILGIILWGCGFDGKSSQGGPGNGTDTGNTIALALKLPNGDPATHARVEFRRIINGNLWEPSFHTLEIAESLHVVFADTEGLVIAPSPTATSQWVATAQWKDSLLGTIQIPNVDTSIVLGEAAHISGLVAGLAKSQRAWIALEGTGIRKECDSLGKYEILNVPPGKFKISRILFKENSFIHSQELLVEPNSIQQVDWTADTLNWIDTISGIINLSSLYRTRNLYKVSLPLEIPTDLQLSMRYSARQVRVYKNNQLLKHFTEQWDSLHNRIWVRLDSIRLDESSLNFRIQISADKHQNYDDSSGVFPATDGWILRKDISHFDSLQIPAFPIQSVISFWMRTPDTLQTNQIPVQDDGSWLFHGSSTGGISFAIKDTLGNMYSTIPSYYLSPVPWVYVAGYINLEKDKIQLYMNGWFEQEATLPHEGIVLKSNLRFKTNFPGQVSWLAIRSGWIDPSILMLESNLNDPVLASSWTTYK